MTPPLLARARHMSTYRPAVFVLGQDEILRCRLCAMLESLPWPVLGLCDQLQLPADLAAGCIVAVQEQELDLIALLRRLRRCDDRVRLILLTDAIDIANAVAALRQGVHDLIELPVVERDLHRRVHNAMLTVKLTNSS